MKDIIINILKQYSEPTSLAEGNFEYMISADSENLNDIANQIEKEIKESLSD